MPDTDRDGIAPEVLQEVLIAARDAGFLGPGPIERHLRHAEGFVTLARLQVEGKNPRILDLGSGGGLNGARGVDLSWRGADVLDVDPVYARCAGRAATGGLDPLGEELERPSLFGTYLGCGED